MTLYDVRRDAGEKLALVFGDPETAFDVGKHFTCYEADRIADALRLLGQAEAAGEWLRRHAESDEPGDKHYLPTLVAASDGNCQDGALD